MLSHDRLLRYVSCGFYFRCLVRIEQKLNTFLPVITKKILYLSKKREQSIKARKFIRKNKGWSLSYKNAWERTSGNPVEPIFLTEHRRHISFSVFQSIVNALFSVIVLKISSLLEGPINSALSRSSVTLFCFFWMLLGFSKQKVAELFFWEKNLFCLKLSKWAIELWTFL